MVKIYLNEAAIFQPQQAAELGSFGHVVLALKLEIEETGYGNCPHRLRKVTEASHESVVSMTRDVIGHFLKQ